MPFIGNGIKSKETGKSGVKTEFTSLFITFHKMVYKIGSGKGSLSTGPTLDLSSKMCKFFCIFMVARKPGHLFHVNIS